nr:PilW family protein [Nitrospirota bacterium]
MMNVARSNQKGTAMIGASDRGFTLIELMISVSIFAVVSAAAFSVLIASQKTATMTDQTVQIQRNVRLAMDLIARDLRMAAFGNPAAGTAGCAQQLTATNSAAGPDSIQMVTVDQQVGTLAAAYTSGNAAITVNNLPAGVLAAADVITLEGTVLASTSLPAGNILTLSSVQSAGSPTFSIGTGVFRLACVTYQVTGADGRVGGAGTVFTPYTLLRNTTGVAGNAMPIVDGIEDLQLAYGIDADSNGTIDDQAGGTANVVDCLDFVPNGTACTQGTTLLAAGTVTALPSSINATPTSVRQVRITVVGRAVPPQAVNVAGNTWKDDTFKSSSAVQAEDHAIANAPGIRRRSLTRVVTLRNAGTT